MRLFRPGVPDGTGSDESARGGFHIPKEQARSRGKSPIAPAPSQAAAAARPSGAAAPGNGYGIAGSAVYSASHQPADWQKLVMLVGLGSKPRSLSVTTSISVLA